MQTPKRTLRSGLTLVTEPVEWNPLHPAGQVGSALPGGWGADQASLATPI